MRTKRIYGSQESHSGYGAGGGDIERYEYECPCGQGMIVEEHDNIPGFREHDVWIACKICAKKYKLDVTRGIRYWELVEIQEDSGSIDPA